MELHKASAYLEHKKWSSDTNYALGLYRFFYKILGIWPINYDSLKTRFRVLIIVLIMISEIWSFTYKLIIMGNCGSILDIVDIVNVTSCCFLAILMIIVHRMEMKKISFILKSVINDWENMMNKKSCVIMKKIAYYTKTAFVIQIVSYCLVLIQHIFIEPLIIMWNSDKDYNEIKQNFRVMPTEPACWAPKNESFNFYIIYYIYQSIQLILVATVVLSYFNFFCGIAMHLYGQYMILFNHLKSINNINNKSKQRKFIYKFLKRHNHLLKVSKYFEEIYNLIIFVDVGNMILIICISGIGLLITVKQNDTYVVSGFIIKTLIMLTRLFIYCFIGEKLSGIINSIDIIIYNDINWHELDTSSIKMLIFVMMRSLYRYELTAYHIVPLNYESFIKIIKLIGSYFSVLRLTLTNV
ncbi:hypothetical protein HCN44_005438 [Aphidius gifuensis]|uniref:Odorant receptor n=1 Tax=Aphidius gifuensis TaxID=684658 RepID=A0A834Y353_APHGI|nr:hypothetical protein HCN44_005438 [Aphidius gifuensis]